jgi:hypothetical protein
MELGTPTTDSDYQSRYNNALTPTEKGTVLRQYKKQYPKLFCKSPWVDTALADSPHMQVSPNPPSSDIAPSIQGERDLITPPQPPAAPLLSKYRSKVKRGILMQLTQNPRASDLDICRYLDADGAVELPAIWKKDSKDRLFAEAYMDNHRRHKVEIEISKVRSDLRKQGLLARR